MVARARDSAQDLAHALKTPLSVLTTEAAAQNGPLAGKVREQAENVARLPGIVSTFHDCDLLLYQAGADALRPDQVAALADAGFALAPVPLDEIEKAGGSLRCCVAEIY